VSGADRDPGVYSTPQILGEVLSDARVQDCLWIGLMEWDLRIQDVALRPQFSAEGGVHPDGWALRVGLGPGVRLEVLAAASGAPVKEVRLIVAPEVAPRLLGRSWWQEASMKVRSRAVRGREREGERERASETESTS
jgi:hypothetical protein